ncbi:MAG: cation diffusion facilitator family transporter [Streptococcaceae bacterium]|nr:cation diffusion facilitator family transporter [Streptococcaceae bacterium]MCL2681211.1 cation diffusion facilitator family transporter [Streptococcaceae bacterium]
MRNNQAQNLKLAEKGVWVSILAYVFLSILQITVASLVHSSSLRANGFNNVTDILGNIALLIGLRIARIPSDDDHTYGHWKVESVASLISSFIMFAIGFEILRETVTSFLSHEKQVIDPIGAVIGVFSAFVMLVVYFYTRKLAKQTRSSALHAASKDNLADALASIATSVAILVSAFHWEFVDKALAIIIALIILKTAYEIFRDCVFTLTDGFDEHLLEDYSQAILLIDKVKKVRTIRGRTYGSNIFLDVVVEMSPDLSVSESHAATEEIEETLMSGFDVFDVDVHVEPATLTDEEHFSSRSLELLAKEEDVLNENHLDDLLDDSYQEISANGQRMDKEEKINSASKKNLAIKSYQTQQVSKRTFMLTYEYTEDNKEFAVTSTWRRVEEWHIIYRQVTKKGSL